MHAIRTVLWTGGAKSLPTAAISQTPWLDVVWEPDLHQALSLSPDRFDAILLGADDPDRALIGVLDLRDAATAADIVVVGPEAVVEAADELLRAGARRVAPVEGTPDLAALLDWLAPESATPRPRRAPFQADDAASELLGASRAMEALRGRVRRIAASEANVLIQGESGSGKERVARAVHALSRRRAGPFVALNCAALPETLLEAELLGAVRGAYTGADRDREGLVQEAQGGTLFLDEIAEASPAFQAKLLRVLQERTVRPLGAREERPVDVRFVAATHRELRREIGERRFRADLYYRLCVLPVAVPPLRERPGDIEGLCVHLLARFAARESRPVPRLRAEALHRLQAHAWPGNVRELENELQRCVTLCDGDWIGPDELSLALAEPLARAEEAWVQRASGEPLAETLARVETWLLRRALDAHAGRRMETARSLGLTREGLYKKLKRFGIE